MRQQRATYDQALQFLGARAHSAGELRRKLRRKGAPEEEINEVLERLQDQKLLDDADFARQFARSRLTSAGTSRRRIVQELGRRGVARDVADRAMADLADDEGVDASSAASRVAAKKWKSLASLDDATRRRRLYAFLARRGFNPEEIRSLMAGLDAGLDD